MGHVENKRKRYISTDSQKKVFSQIRFRKQNKSAPQASAGLFDLSVHSEDAFQTSALLCFSTVESEDKHWNEFKLKYLLLRHVGAIKFKNYFQIR